jgi:hypothetical protein
MSNKVISFLMTVLGYAFLQSLLRQAGYEGFVQEIGISVAIVVWFKVADSLRETP